MVTNFVLHPITGDQIFSPCFRVRTVTVRQKTLTVRVARLRNNSAGCGYDPTDGCTPWNIPSNANGNPTGFFTLQFGGVGTGPYSFSVKRDGLIINPLITQVGNPNRFRFEVGLAGVYEVQATDLPSGCSSDWITLIVAQPVAFGTLAYSLNQNINAAVRAAACQCPGQPFEVTVYQRLPGGGVQLVGLPTLIMPTTGNPPTYTNLGQFPIGQYTIVYRDCNGCLATRQVNVNGGPLGGGPTGGNMQLLDKAAAEEITSTTSWKLYPNPTRDRVSLQFDGFDEEAQLSVQITDPIGREVYNSTLNSSSEIHAVRISEWERGIYFVTVIADGVPIGTERLVVQ
jgi:hypothetical protein